jgi:hypothetical protein
MTKMLFSIEEDGVYLHVNDKLIIPFKDLEEWEKFANEMLGMMPEMAENLQTGNY